MKQHIRLKRIKALLEALASGKAVANREIQTVLNPDQLHDYESDTNFEKNLRALSTTQPTELKKYNNLLHHADLIDGRADALKGPAAIRMRDASQTLYEKALEHLEEWASRDVSSALYLDKVLDFEHGTDLRPDKHSVPRSRFLRSSSSMRSIWEIKKTALERALAELENTTKEVAVAVEQYSTDAAVLREQLRRR